MCSGVNMMRKKVANQKKTDKKLKRQQSTQTKLTAKVKKFNIKLKGTTKSSAFFV